LEPIFEPGDQVELEGEACAVVLFFQEATLLDELASGEHGRPDGAYAGGDATDRYDEGEQRIQVRERPLYSIAEAQDGRTRNRR